MNLGVIVQAHHENWGGGKSYSLSEVNGRPVILWVLRKIRAKYPNLKIVIAVPEAAENRIFDRYATEVGASNYYGSMTNVLERFLGAAKTNGFDAFIRVIGEHYFINVQFVDQLKIMFETGLYDCVIPPHDFDPKFGCDVVSLQGLNKLQDALNSSHPDSIGNILANPIQYMASKPEIFKIGIVNLVPHFTDDELSDMRNIAKQIYLEAYVHDSQKSQREGDTLRAHYELAKKYIPNDATVLDIACGDGWGSVILGETGAKIIGADISETLIKIAKQRMTVPNVRFEVQDALHLNFIDKSLDIVTSMETIEHIEDQAFLREVFRVLHNGGMFIVSTPQSSSTSLPLVPYHLREYSLTSFEDTLSQYFTIVDFYTFRSNLILKGKHAGTGMMAICKKKG